MAWKEFAFLEAAADAYIHTETQCLYAFTIISGL
jgi:hypothetical protein